MLAFIIAAAKTGTEVGLGVGATGVVGVGGYVVVQRALAQTRADHIRGLIQQFAPEAARMMVHHGPEMARAARDEADQFLHQFVHVPETPSALSLGTANRAQRLMQAQLIERGHEPDTAAKFAAAGSALFAKAAQEQK